MENLKVPVAGITRNSSDLNCPDGECAEVINFYLRDGCLQPVTDESPVFMLKEGRKLFFIHRNQGFEHWISYDGATLFYEADESEGRVSAVDVPIVAAAGVSKVESIGNTLIVLGPEVKLYVLFKEGAYRVLGDMPMAPKACFNVQCGLDDYVSGVYTSGSMIKYMDGEKDRITPVVRGALNKEVYTKMEEGYFVFPVLLRFALRLYDGSYIYQSQPFFLSVPNFYDSIRLVSDGGAGDDLFSFKVYMKLPLIEYRVWDIDPAWSDIVRSVDLFVSDDLDYFVPDKEILMFDKVDRLYFVLMPKLTEAELRKALIERSNFYLVKRNPVSAATEISGMLRPLNKELVTLVSQETLPDDFDSHCAVLGNTSLVYNNRLHLGDVRKRLFEGFVPVNTSLAGSMKSITVSTIIKTDAGDAEVVSTLDLGTKRCSGDLLPYLFYPDVRAYKMYVTETTDSGVKRLSLNLTPHPYLNGAYFFSDNLLPILVFGSHSHVHGERNRMERLPNRLYVSEVNNPFRFPADQVYSVSSGRITGAAAATAALSQGQFGQFPLYVFTEDGIWAMEVGTGAYRSQHPVTRDVCCHPDSITQLDSAVAFSTERGLMFLSGPDTNLASATLDGPVFDVRTLPQLDRFLRLREELTLADAIDTDRFSDFLNGAQIGYNYGQGVLVVSTPDKPYVYLYCLDSGAWSKRVVQYDYLLNSYPELYASFRGRVFKLSAPVRREQAKSKTVSGFVSRPFKLAPDVLKRVRQLAVRGGEGESVTLLYGSRDGREWNLISVTDSFGRPGRGLRGNGSPYRYFVVAHLVSSFPDSFVTHTDLLFEPVYASKLR